MTQDDVQKRIDERIKVKDQYRSETDLAIRISWAVNNAVAVMGREVEAAMTEPETMEKLNGLVDFFLKYFDRKKSLLLNEYEKEYQKNPAPLVSDYEAMSDSQKAFLKDKQLENNRANYQVQKNKTPEEVRMERI